MQLPINALCMGFSTKDAYDHLVGHHGEGLEPVPLILSRYGYQVSIAASGCNSRFDTGRHRRRFGFLYCDTISGNQVYRPCPRHNEPTLPYGEGCGVGNRRDASRMCLDRAPVGDN